MAKKLLIGQICLIVSLVIVGLAYRYRFLSFEWFAGFFGALLMVVVLCVLINVGSVLYYVCTSAYSVNFRSIRFARLDVTGLNATRLMSLLLSGAFILFLASLGLQMKRVPVIHDITTDTVNPPIFQHAQINRNKRFNSLEYHSKVAELQRVAYPDIQPLLTSLSKEQVFLLALEVAKESGWRIEFEDSHQGVIEATDKSLLFGFTDDIAIRINNEDELRRIDIRSVSQVGESDLGANADRIQAYSALLYNKIKQESY